MILKVKHTMRENLQTEISAEDAMTFVVDVGKETVVVVVAVTEEILREFSLT